MVLQEELFRPMEEAFRSGTLLLGDQARRAGEALSVEWGDWPLNWGLVIASALGPVAVSGAELTVYRMNRERILLHGTVRAVTVGEGVCG